MKWPDAIRRVKGTVKTKFMESVRKHGWRRTAWLIGHKILASAGPIRYLHFLWVDRRHLVPPPPGHKTGLVVRRLEEQELISCAQDPDLDMEKDFVTKALAGGSLCLGAFEGETLAAYAWFGRRNMELYPGIEVAVDDDAVYTYKVFTLPQYRKRHCQGSIMSTALAMPMFPGSVYMVCLVEAVNFTSLAAFGRMGFRRDGRLYLLGKSPRQRRYFAGGTRRVAPPHITETAPCD